LKIIIINKLSFPGYLNSFLAISSKHLTVLIDIAYSSFFHHTPDRHHFMRTECSKFQTHLEDVLSVDPNWHNAIEMNTCVENFSGAVLKTLTASTPNLYLRECITKR
jgi:hypothetical protein